MANYIQLPNGAYYPALEGEDYATTVRAAYAKYPEAFGGEKNIEEQPKSGFMPALKAGFSNLKGDVAALAGRTGIMGLPEAEKYIAEQAAYQKKTFAPTKESFIEAPLTNIAELAGGSLPYIVAPLVAGAAAPVASALGAGTGLAATLGAGAAALTREAQFTGSNLSRQVQEGKKLGETDIEAAALAAIPQTAFDTIGMRMMPGIGKMFERAGVNISANQARDLAKEGIKKTAADYLMSTGKALGTEGLTEAGQQVFERMQAGLNLTDPAARAEYFDNFLGGAVLGGILAPAGRYVERGQIQGRFDENQRKEQKQRTDEAAKANAEAAAKLEEQRQTPEYALEKQQAYQAAEQWKTDLKAQVHKGSKNQPLTEEQAQENKEIKRQLAEHAPVLTNAYNEYSKYKQFLPTAVTPAVSEEEAAPVTTAAETAVTTPATDPRQQLAEINAKIEALQAQAQDATPEQLVALGAQHTDLVSQLAPLQVAVAALPPAPPAPPTQAQITAQLKRTTTAMNKAKEEGDLTKAGKYAATLLELQKQLQAPEATVVTTPEATVVTTPEATDVTTEAEPTTTAAPKVSKPAGPSPLKPYTGIAEQSLMFPDAEQAESVLNVGQGKQPEKSRTELIAEFQAAKQVRDRLGMQNAIEKMRILDERSKARSAEARGKGVPQGKLSQAIPEMLGQKLTATGSQAPSREIINAGKVNTTPEILRKQIANLPNRLSPESEQLVGRVLDNFNEFTADPERLQLTAGWLNDLRTGVQTARQNDVVAEMNRLDAAKQPKQDNVFEEELPIIEGPRKPLPTPYSEQALPPKPSEQEKPLADWKKTAAELETARKSLDKEKEEYLQNAIAESDTRERTAQQAYNNAVVQNNALKKELDDKILPVYADYVNAMRNPSADQKATAKRQTDTALAYRTARDNNAAALAETQKAINAAEAELKKAKANNRKAKSTATKAMDAAQKAQRLELSRKGLQVETARSAEKAAEKPKRKAVPADTTTLTEREAADAAKRKAENERAERLATIPGESISHEAHRNAANMVKDTEPRLEMLREKAADENLPKTTRDKAKRSIAAFERASAFLAGSNEGLAEMRYMAQERLLEVEKAIKKKAAAVAENPLKSRKKDLATLKREKKALEKQIKGYKERAERTPIETTSDKTVAAKEAAAENYLKMQQELAAKGQITPEMEALLEVINDPQAAPFDIAEAKKQYNMLATQRLPARKVGPVVRKAQAAGDIRTGQGGEAGTEIRRVSPGTKPTQGGAAKSPTPKRAVREANKTAEEKIATNTPLTSADVKMVALQQHYSLFEAAQNMRRNIDRVINELKEKMDYAAKSAIPSEKSTALRREREDKMAGLQDLLGIAKANEDKLAKAYTKEKPAEKQVKAKGKTSRAQRAIEDIEEDFSESRGVEVESPDLSTAQKQHIANNNVQAALRDLADDTAASDLNRAVAKKLSLLLDGTDIRTKENLTDGKGNPILGQAISTEIQLDAKEGMSQEVFLHEGTHAAVDRILETGEDKLTPTQLAAKRELKALFEAAKRDPSITSMNAKSSLKEFAAEVLSNRNLQDQLRSKKWSVSDAFRGFISSILRLIGFTKAETETMLGAGIKAVEALMVPSKQRGITSERVLNAISAKGKGVPRSNSTKDIAALHNGSNSMKQFADQFGPEIKQADRTPADAERIGQKQLDDIQNNVTAALRDTNRVRNGISFPRSDIETLLADRAAAVRKYLALPTASSLDYKVRMSDGKLYDENNPLHYVESTLADQANIRAQDDAQMRFSETNNLSLKRLNDYIKLLDELQKSQDFTSVERALIAKAAGKYSVIADADGRLKMVEIGSDNRHGIAVVSSADAAFVVQKLREGLPLKQAFLEGLQDNADRNAKQNFTSHKTGWQKFEQNDSEKAAQELNAAAAGTPWCTGASMGQARTQIANGDFYIYYDNGRPEVAVRMDGSDTIGEVRGNSPSQSINAKQQQIATDFLKANKFTKADSYMEEFAAKSALVALAKNPNELNPEQLMGFDLGATVADSDVKRMMRFRALDGYGGAFRAEPTAKVVEFFKDAVITAGKKAMDAGYYPTRMRVALYPKGEVTARFNGETVAVNPANVIAVNMLVMDNTPSEAFSNLKSVGNLYLSVDADFDKLNSVKEVASKGDVTLELPSGAEVSLVKTNSSRTDDTLTIKGATVIGEVLPYDKYLKGSLSLKAPDALYIPKEGRYLSDYSYALYNIVNDAAVIAKYGGDEEAIAALAEKMPYNIRSEFELSSSTDPNFSILEDVINANTKSLKDVEKVNKALNSFWTPDEDYKLLPEKFGTIDAPNRISENPPFGELTEAPEAPSYARADYKSDDALSNMAQRAVAQPKTLREKAGSHIALEAEMETANMRAGVITALENSVKDPRTMGSTKLFRQAIFSITAADQHMPISQMAMESGPPKMFKDEKGYYSVGSSMENSTIEMFESVQDIPDSYGNTEAKMGIASMYMIAQRAMNKGLAKLDTGAMGITEQELRDVMSSVDADPALKAALENTRKLYNAYNKGMIEWLASPQVAGITSADAKVFLKDEDYVPFYRVLPNGTAELVFGGEKTITIGDIKHQPYLAELKGGGTKIMPLNESIVRNTMLLVTKGMTNMAQKNVAYAMQAAGEGQGPTGSSLMPIHKGKGSDDSSIIRWTQEPDPRDPKDKGDRWLRIQTNDTMFGGIPAELIIKSLEGAHLTLPAFLKLGGIAGDMLRAGVTRTPIYLARQLIRDPFAATATAGLDYGPLTAIFRAQKEFLKMTTGQSETGAILLQRGLVQSGIYDGSPADVSKMMLQLVSGKGLGLIKRLFKTADGLAIKADAATRALIYDNAIKNGLSRAEAEHAVRESMNFYKRGLSPTVQYASRMIPFFNAQIQGLSVLFKAARGNMPFDEQLKIRKKFINNAMMLTGFGIAYAMAMDDDEYYKNAKPRDRYSNFFMHLPGVDEPVKLPIPYEFGWFFSAGVAAVDAIKGEVNTPQQLRALKDMFVGAIPGASNLGMPQLIKPIAEVYANKNFYSGNAILSTRLEKLDPEAQYKANTTELAKFFGRMVPGLSPIQLEHIVSGYLGQIPLMVAASADSLFAKDSKIAEPTRKLSEMPLIGSSFQRKYGGEDADVVYKLADEALQAKRTFDNYRSTGKIEDAKQYLQDHRAEIRVAPMALQYQKVMGQIRKQEEIIRGSSADGDVKAKRIEELDKQRQLQSERYMKAIQRVEAT
jgi:hypothetical protein